MVKLREIKEVSQEVIIPKKPATKIINCQIKGGDLVAQLDNKQKKIISVSSLTKWGVLDKNTKPEQLKRNEIKSGGRIIYFPDIDEIIPAWKVIEGLFKPCWETQNYEVSEDWKIQEKNVLKEWQNLGDKLIEEIEGLTI